MDIEKIKHKKIKTAMIFGVKDGLIIVKTDDDDEYIFTNEHFLEIVLTEEFFCNIEKNITQSMFLKDLYIGKK